MTLSPTLQPYAQRKVRVVAGYGDAELWALVEIASNGCKVWDLQTWQDYVELVMSVEDTVEDWTAKTIRSRVKP